MQNNTPLWLQPGDLRSLEKNKLTYISAVAMGSTLFFTLILFCLTYGVLAIIY